MTNTNHWIPDKLIVHEQVQNDPATITMGSSLSRDELRYNEDKFPT